MRLAQEDSPFLDLDRPEALTLLLEDLRRAHLELHLRVLRVRILAKEVSWLLTTNYVELLAREDIT